MFTSLLYHKCLVIWNQINVTVWCQKIYRIEPQFINHGPVQTEKKNMYVYF